MTNPDPREHLPLSPLTLLILLALSEHDQHGYDIIRTVQDRWGDTVNPGTGTFYSALKRLLDDGLLQEAAAPPGKSSEGPRRRYYAMTDLGRAVLRAETERLSSILSTARSLDAIPSEGS